MKPIVTSETNFVWRGPTPDIADLPAHMYRPANKTTSVWAPDDEERAAIANGANIELVVYGVHPPVGLSVTNLAEVPIPEEVRERQT